MSKARLLITAVVVEGRSQAQVARDYGVSRSWVSKLVARYRSEGEAAFEGKSRRPHTNPTAIPASTAELLIQLRIELQARGLDAGPETIRWHLLKHHDLNVSRTTISRYLQRQGLITPQPKKRPKSSYIRFQAQMPNECWQSDCTHYPLQHGGNHERKVEILTWLDDHARFALSITAHRSVTASTVLNTFRNTIEQHGAPASTLTDNAMSYTTRFATGKGGRNAFENELRHLGVQQKNSRPNHPTTCGKVERFQQTLKRYLTAQPNGFTSIHQLQTALDTFRHTYNHHRPHRSLPGRSTPAAAYAARPKATPQDRTHDTHDRVRTDRIDNAGRVTLRANGRLHHIGIGRQHAGTRILLLAQDHDIRIIDQHTGELLRHLTLNPTRDYQPTGRPRGRPPKKTKHPKPT